MAADGSSSLRFDPLEVKKRIGRALADEMETDGILQLAIAEEIEDRFAMPMLAFEIGIDLIFQLRRNQALAIVIPLRIDTHDQMSFFPIDRVAEHVPFAGTRRVEPVAEKSVFPDSGDGVLGAGDQARVRRANRLPRERLADPDLALAAIVQADVRIFAVEFVGAESRIDFGAGGFVFLPNAEHENPFGRHLMR